MASRHVKTAPPRQLTANETLDSLDHWKTQFRQFFRHDDDYKPYFSATSTWDKQAANFGLHDVVRGDVTTTAAELAEHLQDFLELISSFLPHSYLTMKIVNDTKRLEDVWSIIYEHYNVKVTSETLLDFESLKKESQENYRMFYERLLQHSRLHLAPKDAKIEGQKNTLDDVMTISLQNHIALQWLRKINPQLISLVRVEYCDELKAGTQLAALVPRISVNIDALLARHGASNLNLVEEAPNDETSNINWFKDSRNRGGAGSFRGGNRRGVDRGLGRGGGRSSSNRLFCPGCFSFAQTSQLPVNFHHSPSNCYRKTLNARMVEHQDEAAAVGDLLDEGDEATHRDSGGYMFSSPSHPASPSQTPELDKLHQLYLDVNFKPNPMPSQTTSCSQYVTPDMSSNPATVSEFSFVHKFQKLEEHLAHQVRSVRKEQSPMIAALVGSTTSTCVIDEGSEMNCIDESFAVRAGIIFIPTSCKAKAAGSSTISLAGQTSQDLLLKVQGADTLVTWNLRKAVVVKNLGVDILVGEPGKRDNFILTLPNEKKLETKDNCKNKVKIKYIVTKTKNNINYVAKVSQSIETIYTENIFRMSLPSQFQDGTKVLVTPARSSPFSQLNPTIMLVSEGHIDVDNKTEENILINKKQHILDIRSVEERSFEDDIRKLKKLLPSVTRPTSLPPSPTPDKKHLADIQIDPDLQLPHEWRQTFADICEQYVDVFNPHPGCYNDSWGKVDNSINWAGSAPPPSLKACLPTYSHDMLQQVAKLMDDMEDWGILKTPEDMGVIPANVAPSMLLPKPEPGEWRLVTDFSGLNIHIKPIPHLSPTIADAKKQLAKFNFSIHLDLSQYFWQGKLDPKDAQYLATPHPFKGLRVYAREPQGLRNASEHSYERLARIFGDLCQEDRMTRMADGLYVLADDLPALKENFEEVLRRARQCGLTFKPKKVVICPRNTVIFGWLKTDNGWRPTEHTVAPLSKAPEPSTVKQLRSFIGSFKQFSECVDKYATLLGPLEDAVAGRKSAERLTWSDALSSSFSIAKAALADIQTIYVPKPKDLIETYSDFSEDTKSTGGSMFIKRSENGVVKKLLGGFYSCRVNKNQAKWLPCEWEALGIRKVLEHFTPYIRESKNVTTHHTDNLPCVRAWRRMKQGHFSTSARVSTFLSQLSCLNVEIVHIPGKDLKLSDFFSRNPNECVSPKCKICTFASELVVIGENVIPLRAITMDDIDQGRFKIPWTQRPAWLKVQLADSTHHKLTQLILTSQVPEPRKTNGDNTYLKRLHNLYKQGNLKLHSDGLITVTYVDKTLGSMQAYSIPTRMFPGLASALHIRLGHPSRQQLLRILSRHFYTPAMSRIIDEITSNCTTCVSLQQLPKEVFAESTKLTPILGGNFSGDVIKAHSQLVLLVREKLSQFTFTKLIEDETANTLRSSLVQMVLEFIPDGGTTIQVDPAPGFATLSAESREEGSVLYRLGIRVEVGRIHNVNKNPIAENAIKEFEKERLRLSPNGGPITDLECAEITARMNSRIRDRGLSSKEILLQRNQISHAAQPVSDQQLAEEQFIKREEHHPFHQEKTMAKFNVGDHVFIKRDISKLRGREQYKIVKFDEKDPSIVILQKTQGQFRAKEYQLKLYEIIPAPASKVESLPNIDSSPPTPNLVNAEVKSRDESTSLTKVPATAVTSIPPVRENIQPEPEPGRRSTRPSALKASAANKSLAAQGLLKLSSDSSKLKPPTHSWNYEEFCNLVEEDYSYHFTRTSHAPRLLTNPMLQEVQHILDETQTDFSDEQEPGPSRPWTSAPAPQISPPTLDFSQATLEFRPASLTSGASFPTPARLVANHAELVAGAALPSTFPSSPTASTPLAVRSNSSPTLIPRPLLLKALAAARTTSQSSLPTSTPLQGFTTLANTPTLPTSNRTGLCISAVYPSFTSPAPASSTSPPPASITSPLPASSTSPSPAPSTSPPPAPSTSPPPAPSTSPPPAPSTSPPPASSTSPCSTSNVVGLNAPSSEDAGSQSELEWDHSPEQLSVAADAAWQEHMPPAMGPLTEEDERQFQHSTAARNLYSSSTSHENLTSSSLDDDVFNDTTPRTIKNSKLQRTGAFRRRRPEPTSPGHVVTWQTQNLEQVLLPHRPLVPEVVPLGPGVVDITNALALMPDPTFPGGRVPLSPVQQQFQDSPGPVLRSRVQQIDFEAESVTAPPSAQASAPATAPADSRTFYGLRDRPRVDYKKSNQGHK